MNSALAPAWTAPLRRAGRGSRCRLVVFPHSGAGPGSYLRLLSGLPDDVELIGVTLPGRERRREEPPGAELAEVVGRTGEELAGLEPLTTVYFGHSLGALLAVLTAAAGPGRCDGLVVSAGLPGGQASGGPQLSTQEGLAALLARHGLPPLRALAAEGSHTRSQHLLARDLELARSALIALADVRLTVPLTALGGADDPLVPAATVPLWNSFTSGRFRSRVAAGGHYFPFLPAGRCVLLSEIAESLAGVPIC